jgi:hypothetical protein
MQHSIEWRAMLPRSDEKVFKESPIRQLSLHEIHPGRDQLAAAVVKIVEDYSLMPPRSQEHRYSSADISSPTSNQNFHKK